VDALFLDVEHRTEDLAAARPIAGRAAIGEMCATWLEQTPDFDYDVLDVLTDGFQAAVLWRYKVRDLELDGVSWLSCRDGEIVDARVYFDSHALLWEPRG
jgi:hypothetical protein